MCGIFGYIGPTSPKASRGKQTDNAAKVIFEGLRRLEYRGYDSWGIAILTGNKKQEARNRKQETGSKILIEKKIGAIGEMNPNSNIFKVDSSVGIGHTRWATHGGVSVKNAHPHASGAGNFVVAQNGIVENFEKLKFDLVRKKYGFLTETDTEVIVRLIEDKSKKRGNFAESVRLAFGELAGRNTIVVMTDEGEIIACRNGSPLVVGTNPQGEIIFSSDTLSFANLATKMVVVGNGQMIVASGGKIELFNTKGGRRVKFSWEKINIRRDKVGKEGFAHYMIKEINEEPRVIENLLLEDRRPFFELAKYARQAKHVYTIGSGTTGIAAAQIAYFLRHLAGVGAVSLVGADAYEYLDLFRKGDLLIAPSQSGETADVLEVLEIAKKKGVKIASNVNMPGAMMTKLSDFKFMTGAGPEICVVSTKVFVAHIAWGYLLAMTVCGKYKEGLLNLRRLAGQIKKYIASASNMDMVNKLVKFLLDEEHIFLLGKAQNFQIIREGMIKLIETSYKHAHAMPAGDLKHYAITLMERGVPVIAAVGNDSVKDDVLNAVSQVKARGAFVIGLSTKNHPDFDYFLKVPDMGEVSSIMNVVPLQLVAYRLAVGLGHNVDRPRNIAKSVTVK